MEDNWEQCFKCYTEQNSGRLTRLGVFEMRDGVVNDEWLDDGLSFLGIDLEPNGHYKNISIHFGTMTHNIPEAVKLTIQYTSSGYEDGLDVLDSRNRVTVMRFEK